MPSPFSKKPVADEGVRNSDYLVVENSTLVCEVCFEETSTGRYFPALKRLEFTCHRGHPNVVKGLEL